MLIEADAIGVNYIDTYFRSGLYPREVPFVLGTEVCGTVAAVGGDVAAIKPGDRVVTANASGAYAEFCTAPADFVAYVPDAVQSDAVASALLKGMTAHYLIKSVYAVQPQDFVLVHAGAGGVGLILTQWATSLGARVITTASTPAKAELSRQAGAVEVLDYPEDPAAFGTIIRDLTSGHGVAAVYDGVGKTTFDASLASLAVRGTLALFGASSGPVPPVDPQRLNAAGSVYLTRPNLAHFTRTRRRIRLACGRTARRYRRRLDHDHRRRALPAGRRRAGAHAICRVARPPDRSCCCRNGQPKIVGSPIAESIASARNSTAR